MLIEVDGLCKRLGQRTILDGVSFAVPRGQTALVTGPSGSGKTTLLRCLNGLTRADAGTIRVGPHEIRAGTAAGAGNDDRRLSALRQRLGLVFQQWHLFAHQTVLENVVEAPVHVAGVPRAEAIERARALLARVGIDHRSGALPHELSGGEQQRAAIARALAMRPDALMLDEPTSALDDDRARDLLALLRELGAGGLTLIVVTHDARVQRLLGGRVLALAEGKLVSDGARS